jgi:hypothetical protein
MALLFFTLLAWLLLWGSTFWFGATSNIFGVMRLLVGLPIVFAASTLSGPVPKLLTFFDISNKQLLILSCVLIIVYWACFGTAAGLLCWKLSASDSGQQREASSKKNKKYTRWTVKIIAVILAIISFPSGLISAPGYISSRYSAGWMRNSVINNLRQIDAAKNQLALEKKLPPNYVPTEAELALYLYGGTNFFNRPSGPLRYVLNPINKPPYAILDSDWRFRRRGWHEGFTFTNGSVFQLP